MIDLPRAYAAFASYVKNYNPQDGKVRLKIVHTEHVAAISRDIAESLHVSKEDIQLAELIGLLHDIGRFEQIKRYGDFRDFLTIDHGNFGAQLLKEGLIERFLDDTSLYDLIITAVQLHNKYRLPDGLDERTLLHCQIIRDADKTDIFRVRTEDPLLDVQTFTREQMENSTVTPELYEEFFQEHSILAKPGRTPADTWIAATALIFDYNFPRGLAILKEKDYISRMIHRFDFKLPDTKEKMAAVEQYANRWLDVHSRA